MLRDHQKVGDWMANVDLMDSYFMIPIQHLERQFRKPRLPFQLSAIRPVLFTKTLKPVLTLLRVLGVKFVVYIDNILVLAETVEVAQKHSTQKV